MVGPGTNATSPGELLQTLADRLPELVEEDLLEIEVERSVRERMAGKPGRVVKVRLIGPEQTLTLSGEGKRPVAEAQRVVRGVVISRQTLPVAQWLDLLAGQLHALASASATDDAAVSRALGALGVREPGSDLVVEQTAVLDGLRMLPVRLAGRVPPDVLGTVERICELLAETLPRVTGPGTAGDSAIPDHQAYTVVRAATDYLPRTLREYVALPTDWAQSHELPSGGTALEALRGQLSVLETATIRMRDAAASADAGQFLANGAFLNERFGVPGFELP